MTEKAITDLVQTENFELDDHFNLSTVCFEALYKKGLENTGLDR